MKNPKIREIKVSPYDSNISIANLYEEVFLQNLNNDKEILNKQMTESLIGVEEKTLKLDESDDSLLLGEMICYQKLDLRIRKNLLSKIDVASISKNEDHDYVLLGLINPERDVEMLKYALAAGFDPSANDGYKDVLEIAVEQCQAGRKTLSPVHFTQEIKENDQMKKDIELIKLMLRTGKIEGFDQEQGKKEAKKIDQILNNENSDFVDDIQIEGDLRYVVRNWENNEIKIYFNNDPVNQARAYISYLYYSDRSIKTEINNSPVAINVLEGVEIEKPSTITKICQSLYSLLPCFSPQQGEPIR